MEETLSATTQRKFLKFYDQHIIQTPYIWVRTHYKHIRFHVKSINQTCPGIATMNGHTNWMKTVISHP